MFRRKVLGFSCLYAFMSFSSVAIADPGQHAPLGRGITPTTESAVPTIGQRKGRTRGTQSQLTRSSSLGRVGVKQTCPAKDRSPAKLMIILSVLGGEAVKPQEQQVPVGAVRAGGHEMTEAQAKQVMDKLEKTVEIALNPRGEDVETTIKQLPPQNKAMLIETSSRLAVVGEDGREYQALLEQLGQKPNLTYAIAAQSIQYCNQLERNIKNYSTPQHMVNIAMCWVVGKAQESRGLTPVIGSEELECLTRDIADDCQSSIPSLHELVSNLEGIMAKSA